MTAKHLIRLIEADCDKDRPDIDDAADAEAAA